MNGTFLDALRHAYNTRMEAIDTWVDVLVPPKAEAFVVGGTIFVRYAAYMQRVQLDDDKCSQHVPKNEERRSHPHQG